MSNRLLYQKVASPSLILPVIGVFMPGAVVVPGSFTQTVPGTYNFIVPYFNSLDIELWGGGAGGAAGLPGTGGVGATSNAQPGQNGGSSSIASLGLTAQGGFYTGFFVGTSQHEGLGGVASGFDTNTSGGDNNAVSGSLVSGSGAGPGGGAGVTQTVAGNVIGGGGGQGNYAIDFFGSPLPRINSGGPGGAYGKKTYLPTTLAPGTVLSYTVGIGGARCPNWFDLVPGNGARGQATFTWT